MQVQIKNHIDYIDGIDDILRLIRDHIGYDAYEASQSILHQIEREKHEVEEAMEQETNSMAGDIYAMNGALQDINAEMKVIYPILQEARIAKDTKQTALQACKNISVILRNHI